MKKILLALVIGLFVVVNFSFAASRVSGYRKSNGTYVQSYYRSSPDSSRYNNYSSKGNYNPYTGKKGYASPYKYRW